MNCLRNKYMGIALRILIILVIPFTAKAQSNSEKRKIFAKAESHLLYEEYEQANQLYLQLETPVNMNIKYKIGVTYLNILSEKEKAIPYLEEAVKTANYNSKTAKFRENAAPLDAYFFLAKAYMINNDLEKALNTLNTFKNLLAQIPQRKPKSVMANQDFIEQQIRACSIALELKKTPVSFTKTTLGQQFSIGEVNENPAVSFDGNSIVYAERRGFTNAILYSVKENGIWQTPRDITAELNAGEDSSPSSLNYDGTELFLYKTDNYDGNIYSSTLENGVWTPVKKLNGNINTKFYESHASISADGQKLYFTSNRDGGYGGLDIYVSERNASGDWGAAVNLGPTINTPYNEDTPFITIDGSVLYFSSEGHGSMGGYDIFGSSLIGSAWQTPENIGYPINTTDDDRFFQPADNGAAAYYSMTTDYKKRDIMFLEFDKTPLARTFEINGIYSLSDTLVAFDKNYYFIYLVNSETGDTLDVAYPNRNTGRYSFTVPPGKYTINYTGSSHFSHTVDTTLVPNHPSSVITINVKLEPDPSKPKPRVYEAIDLRAIPELLDNESMLMIVNVNVRDLNGIDDEDVLYYTVQVMALYNPVDVSYFLNIDNVRVIYNPNDYFYRYTTGLFQNRDEAYYWRDELMRRGYPDEIFVKAVILQ